MDVIRAFELKYMSYSINSYSVCHECRIEMGMVQSVCKYCHHEKGNIEMFSTENIMHLGKVLLQLKNLTIVEQQLISRISPCIQVHMLKHGGIGSSLHCYSFPPEINQPQQIFPRLPLMKSK